MFNQLLTLHVWSLGSLFCLHNLFKLSIMGPTETPLCSSKHNEQTSHPHCSSYNIYAVFNFLVICSKNAVGIYCWCMRLWSTIKVIYVMRSNYYTTRAVYTASTAGTQTAELYIGLMVTTVYCCSVVRISTLLI